MQQLTPVHVSYKLHTAEDGNDGSDKSSLHSEILKCIIFLFQYNLILNCGQC
jgi:hypothetical protein